jgi:hypothetical protein
MSAANLKFLGQSPPVIVAIVALCSYASVPLLHIAVNEIWKSPAPRYVYIQPPHPEPIAPPSPEAVVAPSVDLTTDRKYHGGGASDRVPAAARTTLTASVPAASSDLRVELPPEVPAAPFVVAEILARSMSNQAHGAFIHRTSRADIVPREHFGSGYLHHADNSFVRQFLAREHGSFGLMSSPFGFRQNFGGFHAPMSRGSFRLPFGGGGFGHFRLF